MQMIDNQLQNNLRSLRRARNLTQAELAALAKKHWHGVSRSNIAMIETRDAANTTTDVLRAMAYARALGVTVDQLVIGEGEGEGVYAAVNEDPARYSLPPLSPAVSRLARRLEGLSAQDLAVIEAMVDRMSY